jgi:hypothetical protein
MRRTRRVGGSPSPELEVARLIAAAVSARAGDDRARVFPEVMMRLIEAGFWLGVWLALRLLRLSRGKWAFPLRRHARARGGAKARDGGSGGKMPGLTATWPLSSIWTADWRC